MAPPAANNSRPETNSPQLPKITITAVHRDSLAKPRHVTIPSNEQQIFTAHPPSPEPLNTSVAAGNGQTKSTTLTVPSNPPPPGHRSDAECGSATDESYAGWMARHWLEPLLNTDKSYADWMSRFCFEPPGDARACCEGCFIPFALFGKTHWRLKQITQGGDPLDSNWHSKDGCNGCCWAWLGLRLLSFDCEFSSRCA
jgi:hypothetical protein